MRLIPGQTVCLPLLGTIKFHGDGSSVFVFWTAHLVFLYNLKIHECVVFGDFPAKVICESQPLDWTKETCKLFVHVMLSALIFSHQNLLHENL
jgi:hypothetical protein